MRVAKYNSKPEKIIYHTHPSKGVVVATITLGEHFYESTAKRIARWLRKEGNLKNTHPDAMRFVVMRLVTDYKHRRGHNFTLRAMAKCSPEDVFMSDVGERIAKLRLKKKINIETMKIIEYVNDFFFYGVMATDRMESELNDIEDGLEKSIYYWTTERETDSLAGLKKLMIYNFMESSTSPFKIQSDDDFISGKLVLKGNNVVHIEPSKPKDI